MVTDSETLILLDGEGLGLTDGETLRDTLVEGEVRDT